MKSWTPESIAAIAIIATLCILLLTMETGIVVRSQGGDVSESRQLLQHSIDVLTGMIAGFFFGKGMADKKTDDPK